MKIFGITFFSFIVSFCIHFLVWKIRCPKNQLKSIFVIFSISYIIQILIWRFYFLLSFSSVFHVSFFYYALLFTYLISYLGILYVGPSCIIAMKLNDAASKGLDKNDLNKVLEEYELVSSRMKELYDDNLILNEKNKIRITKKGKYYLLFFQLHRIFSRLNHLGG